MEAFGWALLGNVVKWIFIILVAPFTLTLKYTIMYWPQIKIVLPYLIALVVLRVGLRMIVRAYTPVARAARKPIGNGWKLLRRGTARCRAAFGQRTSTAKEQARSTRTEERHDPAQRSPMAPYEVLGVQPGASKEEIKAAYRDAMLKNHPDRVAHLDPVLQELAAKRAQEITAAFSYLCGR